MGTKSPKPMQNIVLKVIQTAFSIEDIFSLNLYSVILNADAHRMNQMPKTPKSRKSKFLLNHALMTYK